MVIKKLKEQVTPRVPNKVGENDGTGNKSATVLTDFLVVLPVLFGSFFVHFVLNPHWFRNRAFLTHSVVILPLPHRLAMV